MLEELQELKTGALISAAVEMGCILAGGTGSQRKALKKYARKLGLAFQIRDDMLDVTGTEEELGKSVGSDAREEKNTFVTLRGLSECGRMVEELTAGAVAALEEEFEHPEFLAELARTLVGRNS